MAAYHRGCLVSHRCGVLASQVASSDVPCYSNKAAAGAQRTQTREGVCQPAPECGRGSIPLCVEYSYTAILPTLLVCISLAVSNKGPVQNNGVLVVIICFV